MKSPVSPQSRQAYKIECTAADKQLISITGGNCVNGTSADQCRFHSYAVEIATLENGTHI